ncbi:MAG: arginine biosynthesis protein ArgJ [Spirochaetaceae bacterium]|nr:MAG: arginine biosynthesis protein ArgJ [Spirochaetaceae bacterium]
MEFFDSEAAWLDFLRARAPFPDGFRAATAGLSFTPAERPSDQTYSMNLALITADPAVTSFAALFTRNRFPGAPVIIARERVKGDALAGILVNNRISNVCSPTGIGDAERLTRELARYTGGRSERYLSVSTGIIGWSLPLEPMVEQLPALVNGLGSADALDTARAIMTTDGFPKLRAASIGRARVVGVAKGAGMIEPNLATMLVFFFTDARIERRRLQRSLTSAVESSFNRISIDGDQSTSDMVLAMSSCLYDVDPAQFDSCLQQLAAELAQDIVRNGEGTCHVIRATLRGLRDERTAAVLAKGVINSPLVKTAVYGNDPNVGRIVAALGDIAGNQGIELDAHDVTITIGAEKVFGDGVFWLDKHKENRLCSYLRQAALDPSLRGYPQHDRTVDIDISCGSGSAATTVFGSDLSHEYVSENADYRT